MQPVSTLNDHEDGVRFISYSKAGGRLFSASDDGKVLMWDLSVEKLLQKYEIAEKEGSQSANQFCHSLELLNTRACPTAMTSSPSGNLVFVAFSDNSLKMIDTRV